MIVYSTADILVAPLFLFIWLLDLYLSLACIRLLLAKLSAGWAVRLRSRLAPFTDSVPDVVEQSLNAGKTRPIRRWVPWVIVLATGVVVRHLMLWAIHLAFRA